MTVTTDDVRDALSHLSTVEHENSDIANGLRVAVDEEEIGLFWQAVRQNGFEARANRFGDSLVAHIEAEESGGLGDLFG
jgi:hypothetical protein